MVIGNGMLAKAFAHYANDDEILIFASGVSNSKDLEQSSFEREVQLLKDCITNHSEKTLIYFSTGSIYDEDQKTSKYVQHKLAMEKIIEKQCRDFIIFRLTNPIGKTTNSHTILNYLMNQIQNERQFSVWKFAERNLMDIDDVVAVCDHVIARPENNHKTVDVANPQNYSVVDIVSAIEKLIGKKALCVYESKGGAPKIDHSVFSYLYKDLNINFDSDYLDKLLKKYF